jgi:hypothetical protein
MVTRTSQGRGVPRGATQGAASGTFFLTFFGAYWGFTSAVFLSGAFQILSFLLVGLVTLAFFGSGAMLLRQVRALPKEPSREDGARGRSIVRGFSIIFGLEIVLIALASMLLSIFPLSRFIAPTTALIVGLHFIPLARLFQVSVGYVTGALLCLLALIALLALLSGVPLAGSSPYNWSLFVGVGATLVIWVTDLFMIRYGWKSIHQRGEEN